MIAARAFVLCLLLAAAGAAAQEAGQPFRSPILTIDQERLFSESRAGQAVLDALEADTAALAAENRRIEAALIEEERELTDKRAQLAPDAFRPLAEAFDEKVVSIRREQDAKARALAQRRETDQQEFFRKAMPLVAELVGTLGAIAVLDRSAVILSAEQADITDEAIALIDDRMAPEEGRAPPDAPAPDSPPARGEE